MKTIFSCLNLKPDDGFLPYKMPKVFNKTGQVFPRDLVLKNLGLLFGCHTDFLIQICNTKFQQPGYYDFSVVTFSNYLTHLLGNL